MDAQKKTAAPVTGAANPVVAAGVDKIQGTEDQESSLAWFDDEIAVEPASPRRTLLRTALVGSIVLCAATVALWHVPSAHDAGRAMLGLAASAQQPTATRIARAPVQVPDIKLAMPERQIAATVGQAASLPVSIDSSVAVPQGSFVLVRGVPERATLSSGMPFGEGTWKLDPSALSQLTMTIFNLPTSSPRIAVELLSGQGDVIAKAETMVAASTLPAVRAAAAQPAPARETTVSPVTYPPLKAEAAAARAGQRPAKIDRQPVATKAGKQTAERATVPRPPQAATKQVASAATPQPNAKNGWKMNWDSVTYGR